MKKIKCAIFKSVIFFIVSIISSTNISAATINSIKNGNWNDPLSWSCNCIPGEAAGDIIVIKTNHTITITGTNDYEPSFIVSIRMSGGRLQFEKKLTLKAGSTVYIITVTPGVDALEDNGSGNSSKLIIGGTTYWSGNQASPSAGVVYPPSSPPLPVELLYFNVKSNNEKVLISWATAQEINNKSFDVEKSYDGISFFTLTSIDGKGNSSSNNFYQTEDTDLKGKMIYYRLKQIDFNGQSETFKIKSVTLNNWENTMAIFPNPIQNNEVIHIELPNIDTNQETTIELLDRLGQVVYSRVCTNYDSGFSFIINPNNTHTGCYFIKASNNQQVYQQKILIQ